MNYMVFLSLVCSSAFAQTPDTLQSLLTEVHQLRQAIEGMTVASQRVQIALYTLQIQDGAVARAAQRADAAHNRCLTIESDRGHTASGIQYAESALAAGTRPKSELEQFRNDAARMKTVLEEQITELQTCQAAEAEASNHLRSEQAKLAESQDRIARLDSALAQLAGQSK